MKLAEWLGFCSKEAKRFTESALIKQLEDKGIGRPSTYANIISTLKNRQYIVKKSSRFKLKVDLPIIFNLL